MKFFYLNFFLITLIFTSSCGSVKKAFENERKNSNDEFLVQKKSPLIMPPDFDDLPNPNSENIQVEKDDTDLKDLISDKNENSNKENVSKNQDFEESILEKIQNN